MTAAQQRAIESAGLVVMLDSAGRTISELEGRVEQLSAALVAERAGRLEAEHLLAELRATLDTPDVDPQDPPVGDDEQHDDDPAAPAPS